MAMKQEANAPVILTIGAVSAVLVLVTMFGIEAWFRFEQRNEETEQWDNSTNSWLDALRGPQKARLDAPAGTVDSVNDWVAKEWPRAELAVDSSTTKPVAAPGEKPFHLPIDQAMQEIVRNNGQLSAEAATRPTGG